MVLTDATICYDIPDGIQLTGIPQLCTEAARRLTCYLGTIAPQTPATFSIEVIPQRIGAITHEVLLESNSYDNELGNNRHRITTTVVEGIPAVTIRNPAEQIVQLVSGGPPFRLNLAFKGWAVAQGGSHYHVWVDNQEIGDFFRDYADLSLTDGWHTIKVKLAKYDHSVLDISATMRVQVNPPPPVIQVISPLPQARLRNIPGAQVRLAYLIDNWNEENITLYKTYSVMLNDTVVPAAPNFRPIILNEANGLRVGNNKVVIQMIDSQGQPSSIKQEWRFDYD